MTDDIDDDRTVEQRDEPGTGDNQPASGGSDAGVLNPGEAEPSADGGTADSAPAGGTEQTGAGDAATGEGSSGESRTAGQRLAWLVQIGALVLLCLLALVATFRFYFAASRAIEVWIADDFVSLFQAAFNLLVLIASVYGVSVLVRRLG